jgi:hypothetical protein
MPQTILPLFTEELTIVNEHIGVSKRDGMVYYFRGAYPFYHHREDNRSAFKHIICQLLSNGIARRSEVSKAFCIPERSISRCPALFKEHGENYFFRAVANRHIPAYLRNRRKQPPFVFIRKGRPSRRYAWNWVLKRTL